MNLRRLLAIVKKEFLHIVRDPGSLGIAVAMPIMMLLMFGYAVSTDVDHVATAVLDQSVSQGSKELIRELENTSYFDVKYVVQNYDEIRSLIDGNHAKAGIIIPSNYETLLKENKAAPVQLVVDGSDPIVARTLLSAAHLWAQVKSAKLGNEAIVSNPMAAKLSRPAIDLRTQVWYNPDLVSEKFYVPGLIGIIMQNITVMLTAFSLVREKEKGTLEQLIVSPIKAPELIVGKLLPYVLIGFLDFLFVLALGTWWFQVPIQGNIFLLLGLGMIFVFTALGFGMLFSTIAQNQLQAMQLTVFFILPSVLLSGFLFPREVMPTPIQWISSIIPLTYFLHILRGIILKGVSVDVLHNDVIILAAVGFVILSIATFRFKKKLD